MAYTLTASKTKFDNICKKIDKVIAQMETLETNSDEYLFLKEELKRLTVSRIYAAEELKKLGNKDPAYMYAWHGEKSIKTHVTNVERSLKQNR